MTANHPLLTALTSALAAKMGGRTALKYNSALNVTEAIADAAIANNTGHS